MSRRCPAYVPYMSHIFKETGHLRGIYGAYMGQTKGGHFFAFADIEVLMSRLISGTMVGLLLELVEMPWIHATPNMLELW